MKRLSEIEAPSPLVGKAQALIDAVDPVPVSQERMLRVRRELDRPRGLLAAARRLPALAVATLIVMFGASAFAAVRIYVAVVAVRAPEVQPAEPPAPSHAGRKARRPARKPPTPDPAVVVENAADSDANENQEAAPSLGKPARLSTEPRVHNKSQGKLARNAIAADSELVHRAVKALRRDGNPLLAARLLDESRARNPESPLAEEALSLRIEAAVELGEARSRRLAREYIARYPHGRYLSVARRALEDAAP